MDTEQYPPPLFFSEAALIRNKDQYIEGEKKGEWPGNQRRVLFTKQISVEKKRRGKIELSTQAMDLPRIFCQECKNTSPSLYDGWNTVF
jgi:hypothetical protein